MKKIFILLFSTFFYFNCRNQKKEVLINADTAYINMIRNAGLAISDNDKDYLTSNQYNDKYGYKPIDTLLSEISTIRNSVFSDKTGLKLNLHYWKKDWLYLNILFVK